MPTHTEHEIERYTIMVIMHGPASRSSKMRVGNERLNSGLRAALTPTATQSNFDTFMADILDVSAPSFMME